MKYAFGIIFKLDQPPTFPYTPSHITPSTVWGAGGPEHFVFLVFLIGLLAFFVAVLACSLPFKSHIPGSLTTV